MDSDDIPSSSPPPQLQSKEDPAQSKTAKLEKYRHLTIATPPIEEPLTRQRSNSDPIPPSYEKKKEAWFAELEAYFAKFIMKKF